MPSPPKNAAKTAPGRKNSRVWNMQVRVDKPSFLAVKGLALELELTVDALLTAALNDFLAKHGKTVTVGRDSPDQPALGQLDLRAQL